jgi:mannose-6-phosphate isomerase-like protein (cupin superfamily)
MPTASLETASSTNDYGAAVDHTEVFGDYTVNFVTIRQDADLTQMLKGLPDDRCQCPHWGYVFKGQLTVRYADHDEVIESGDAYYMPPGHVPAARAGSEFIQFSPSDALRVSEEQMARNMQAMQGG